MHIHTEGKGSKARCWLTLHCHPRGCPSKAALASIHFYVFIFGGRCMPRQAHLDALAAHLGGNKLIPLWEVCLFEQAR